jgi:hypothetical protein
MRHHAALVIVLCLAGGSAAEAGSLPHIGKVLFSSQNGLYAVTIKGRNFGAAPASVPCTACMPVELTIIDTGDANTYLPMNVVSWSDTEIDITGVGLYAGEAVHIAAYNDTIGNAGAWGGLVSANAAAPVITSVVASGSGQTLILTINGSGFGPAPPGLGPNINTPYLIINDYNAAAPGSDGYPWNAGFCGQTSCDGVTANYQSWSDGQIVISGFAGDYGQGDYVANPKDALCVGVWASTSQSDGTTGADAMCIRLPKK